MKQQSFIQSLVLWVLMLTGLLISNSASAQVLVAASLDEVHTHAWAVYENSNDEILLVHLPPRDGDLGARIPMDPAAPGELYSVRTLSKVPDGLAAIGNRVFIVFPAVEVGERTIRRVYSGQAVASPVGSVWSFVPSGRLDSEPAIPADGELVDFVATSESLWALLKSGNEYALMTLGASSWEAVALPRDDTPSWRISAAGDQLIAIDFANEKSMRAFGLAENQEAWISNWGPAPKQANEGEIVAGLHGVYLVDRDEQGAVEIRTWSQAGVFTIATGLELPINIELAALGSVNRFVGISEHVSDDTDEIEISGTPSSPLSAVQVYEIDLADGSVVYAGDPVVSSPVSVAEMRFLMGMMVLIMVGVLVVVIMPDKADAMGIPEGFALSDPGRRFIATMFDVFLVSFLMGLLFDVRVIEIITLSVIVRSDASWLVMPMVMISGIVSMSVLEWLFGASPGKWLMGIRVVRGQGGTMQRIPLWAAVVRNVIKWLLPPVAALALLDPEMLHRGDRATKTLVVAPIEGFDGAQKPEDSDSED